MKFSGRLGDFSLPDLLRILIQGQKVGYLAIFSKGQESRIYVQKGQLHHAQSDGLTGEGAVFHLLTYDANSEFEFLTTDFFPDKTLHSDLDTLIQNGIAYLEKWRKMTKKYPKVTINTEISLSENQASKADSKDEEDILQALITQSTNTLKLYQLSDILDKNIFELAEHLIELENRHIIQIIGEERLELRRFFIKLANSLYSEFESISGLKLTRDIENRFQQFVEAKGWNLVLRNGKIQEDTILTNTLEEQKIFYREYLGEMIKLIAPIYGKNFIQEVINKVKKQLPGTSEKWLQQLELDVA